jgi:hypothetical protein
MRFYKIVATACIAVQAYTSPVLAQQDPLVAAMVKEAIENSQLKRMSHELMDGVGPRLVGSSKMLKASDWAITQYKQYGIEARRENYGTWRGWDRGITHVDMVSPWIKSLEATQLAFSPST